VFIRRDVDIGDGGMNGCGLPASMPLPPVPVLKNASQSRKPSRKAKPQVFLVFSFTLFFSFLLTFSFPSAFSLALAFLLALGVDLRLESLASSERSPPPLALPPRKRENALSSTSLQTILPSGQPKPIPTCRRLHDICQVLLLERQLPVLQLQLRLLVGRRRLLIYKNSGSIAMTDSELHDEEEIFQASFHKIEYVPVNLTAQENRKRSRTYFSRQRYWSY
jgi:hypothetical protein